MTGVSVLILTLNEEIHLSDCLASVAWSDDIHVVDSGSTDRTVELARAAGAHVHVYPFENFSRQRNWSLENIPFRHQWLLVLDADETTPPELIEEIRRTVAQVPEQTNGYAVRRKVIFMGRWLQYAGLFEVVWLLRLFRHERIRYEDRPVNAHPLAEGQVGRLRQSFLHGNRKGVTDLMEKFGRYALLEAEETERAGRGKGSRQVVARLTGTAEEQRRWLKRVSRRLPVRGLLKFFYLFVLCRGFRDGWPGFFYAALMGAQEFLAVRNVGCLRCGLPLR